MFSRSTDGSRIFVIQDVDETNVERLPPKVNCLVVLERTKKKTFRQRRPPERA